MDKLKTYKTFEEWQPLGTITEDPRDINYEDKIEEVLQDLMKRKQYISMLKDTVDYICNDLEKAIPDMDQFVAALEHYDDDVYQCFLDIRENMLDGIPNIKDTIEMVSEDFNTIENYLNHGKK